MHNRICSIFNNVKHDIKRYLRSIDYDASKDTNGFVEAWDARDEYVLTDDDKQELINSFIDLYDKTNKHSYRSTYEKYVGIAEKDFPIETSDDFVRLIEFARKEYHSYSNIIEKPFAINMKHLITMFIKLSHKYQTGEDIEDVDDAVDAVLDDYLS